MIPRSALATAAVLGLVVSGCGDPPLVGTQTLLTVEPRSLIFEPLYLGQEGTAAVRLEADGSGPVALTVHLQADPGFALRAPAPTRVRAGTVASVEVAFAPVGEGPATGVLILESDAENAAQVEIALEGTGLPVPSCDDANPCTDDVFDPVGGRCTHVPRPGSCDDGSACTEDDRCDGGRCVGVAVSCADEVACTVDACEPSVGCVFVPDAARCDDGNPCTVGYCDPAAGCGQTDAPDWTPCGEGDPCRTAQVCLTGTCRDVPVAEGSPCDDGDACTVGDRCVAQACVGTPGALPTLEAWTGTFGYRHENMSGLSGDTVMAALSDGRLVVVDPGPVLTLVDLSRGDATVRSRHRLEGVDVVSGLAEVAPGRVLAVTYTEPDAWEAVVLDVGRDDAWRARGRTGLWRTAWTRASAQSVISGAAGLAVVERHFVDIDPAGQPAVHPFPSLSMLIERTAVDGTRRRALLRNELNDRTGWLPYGGDYFDFEPEPALDGYHEFGIRGDLLLAQNAGGWLLWGLSEDRALATGTFDGPATAALTGAGLVLFRWADAATAGSLEWWSLEDPERPALVATAALPPYPPQVPSKLVVGPDWVVLAAGPPHLPFGFRLDGTTPAPILAPERGGLWDVRLTEPGLVTVAPDSRRAWTIPSRRPELVETVPSAGFGPFGWWDPWDRGWLAFLPESGARRGLVWKRSLPNWTGVGDRGFAEVAQALDLGGAAPATYHPLKAEVHGHYLAAEDRIWRLQAEAGPAGYALIVEAYDPAAWHVAEGGWTASQTARFVVSDACEAETRPWLAAAALDAVAGTMGVSVACLFTPWEATSARLLVLDLQLGTLRTAVPRPSPALSLAMAGGRVAAAEGPLVLEHVFPMPLETVSVLELTEPPVELASWDASELRVLQILAFDGRDLWLSAGARPRPEEGCTNAYFCGSGRLIRLDADTPEAEGHVIALPQAPASLAHAGDRLYVGGPTTLSVVGPLCP